MPGEILAGLAGAVLPGLGAQAAAQQQRRWALEDLEAQNIYNSPLEQLRRLKEAGLPAAAFFSGGVSSQSDQPRTTNVDPTMGIAEGVQNFFQNRMQRAQLGLLKAQTRKMDAEADEAEGRTNILKSPMDNFFGGISTHQGVTMSTELDKKQADASAANATQMIAHQIASSGEGDILRQLKEGELDKLLTGNQLLKQVFEDNQLFLGFKRKLAERLRNATSEKSMLSIFEELLGTAIFQFLRTKQ